MRKQKEWINVCLILTTPGNINFVLNVIGDNFILNVTDSKSLRKMGNGERRRVRRK